MKFLTDGMSKDTEFRRTSSPVAKLMGLDMLPVPPQHSKSTSKQRKKPSGNYLSFGNSHGYVPSYENQLFTRSSKEQQKFKDVYEVLEASMKERNSFSAHNVANLKPDRAKMEFIQKFMDKNFMDAKRLACDEKLQDSKEFNDALEVLDANKNLLLKYLQQPDSLFAKHLHDINDVLPNSNGSRIAGMRSSDDKYHMCHYSSRKSARRNSRKKHTRSHKHCNGHFCPSDCNYVASNSVNASRTKVEEDERLTIFPKRIVVLKPNLGDVQNASGIVLPSSHAFQIDCRKHSGFERTKIGGMDHVGFLRHKTREHKEISKIARRIRENFDTGSKSSSLGIIGHDGSASSSTGNGLDAGKYNSNDLFGLNSQWQSSSFQHKKSSMNREAEKRLSERWRITSDFHNVGVVSRGCTLAEMLAMSEKEMTSPHLEPRFGEGSSGKIHDDMAESMEHFGISSRDGWKDICLEKLSRSKSLPASSTSFASPKRSPQSLSMDRYVMQKEWEKKETVSESSCNRGCKVCRKSRSRKKSRSSICTVGEYNDPVLEFYTNQNRDSDFKVKDPAEKNLLVIEGPTFFSMKDQTEVLENRMDMRVTSDNVTVSSNEKLQPEFHSMVKDNSYSGNEDCLMPKEPSPEAFEDASFHLKSVPGIGSSVSSKEADQPSPVSVLEPPFTDDPPPGSDCFESLSADLHGLRMQLKLLKLESEGFAEGPISSDEDIGEGSTGFTGEKEACEAEGSWEFSYLADVLHDFALSDTNPDMFIAMWHSRECPINPSIFEELEKKYADWPSQPRSERRLLFDRINLGILDIYLQFTDPHPWLRPTRFHDGYKESLWNNLSQWLAKQVKKVDEDIVENVLERRTQWLVLGYDLDIIGKEVERLLIDELVAEVVDM